MSTPSLLPKHREHLRQSGLSDETIASASISSVTDPEIARGELGWRSDGPAPPTPSIRFEYFGTDYLRYRPDSPRRDGRGRAVRYEAPRGIPAKMYVPLAHAPAIGDSSVALWLTEGEKKCLASCEAGLPTVAAPGVFMFHDVDARRAAESDDRDVWKLHPDLLPLVTKGRKAILTFDSDIDNRMEVARAAVVATSMFADNEATTFITYIPSKDAKKVGIDDLYLSLGRNAQDLRELLGKATRPTSPAPLLDWLGRDWKTWSADQQLLELRRALVFVAGEEDEAGRDQWISNASKTLGETKKHLRALLAGVSRRLANAALSDGNREGTWMEAPGFKVVGEGPKAGVWAMGGSFPKRITSAPINVTAVGTAEDGTLFCTLRFSYLGRNIELTVPRGLISGPQIVELAAKGAPINQANYQQVETFIQRQEQTHQDRIGRGRVFTRPGWSTNFETYTFGHNVIGGDGRALLAADDRFLDSLQSAGDERLYLQLVDEFRRSSALAEMMFAAGFAGVLLRPLQQRSFLVSLWGASGSGKSAAQALAMSAWGRPEGLKITANATFTAMEATLARSRDGTVWFDDSQQSASREGLDRITYLVGDGLGRARGTVGGDLRQPKEWIAVGLMSGEHPLIKPGAAAGSRNRAIEMRVSQIVPPALGRRVHQELEHLHGWTGPHFVRSLMAQYIRSGNLYQLADLLKEFSDALAATRDSTVDHVGVLVLAAYLARMFIFAEEHHAAHAGALAMGHEISRIARSAADFSVDTIEAAYDAILGWVASNDLALRDGAQKRLGMRIEPARMRGIDQKWPEGRGVVAILREPLIDLARTMGFNVEEVMHALLDRGLLIPGEANRLQRKTEIDDHRVRAYWVVVPMATESPAGKGGVPAPDAASPAALGPKRRTKAQVNPGPSSPSPRVPASQGNESNIAKLDSPASETGLESATGTGGTVGTEGESDAAAPGGGVVDR